MATFIGRESNKLVDDRQIRDFLCRVFVFVDINRSSNYYSLVCITALCLILLAQMLRAK